MTTNVTQLLETLDQAMAKFTEESTKTWSPEKVRAAETADEVFKQFAKMLSSWKREGKADGKVQDLAIVLADILEDAEEFRKEVEDFIASVKLNTAEARANGATIDAEPEQGTGGFGNPEKKVDTEKDSLSWEETSEEFEEPEEEIEEEVEEEDEPEDETPEEEIEDEELEDEDEERFKESFGEMDGEGDDITDDRVVDAWVGYMLSLGLDKAATLNQFEEYCVDPDTIPEYFKYPEELENYDGSILANLEAIPDEEFGSGNNSEYTNIEEEEEGYRMPEAPEEE